MYRAFTSLSVFAYVQTLVCAQAVTSAVSPTAPAPFGCSALQPGSFGIAVLTLATPNPVGTTLPSSSLTIDSRTLSTSSGPAVSQIGDGQIQAPPLTAPEARASVRDMPDEVPASQSATTLAPIAQIADGQIQHQTSLAKERSTHEMETMQPVTQIADGQIQATLSPPTSKGSAPSARPAEQDDKLHQPKAPTSTTLATSIRPSALPGGDGASDAPVSSPALDTKVSAGAATVGCRSNSTLVMTLRDGLLVDNQGRTGYIANNFQFQFDKPAQAGAIYTAGWSACSNGTLALGGSSVFWQCLSGDFYNLYDRNFGAGQCAPILFQIVELQDC